MSTLVWGVKASLLGYIRGMGEGSITLDGVEQEPSGFAFPGTDAEGHAFRGSVTLDAHGGIMHVVLTDPAIEPDGAAWVLTINDPDDASKRLRFASIASLSEQNGFLVAAQTALTADGAELFFGPYTPGTPLDDPFIRP